MPASVLALALTAAPVLGTPAPGARAEAKAAAPRVSVLTGPGDRTASRTVAFTFGANQSRARYSVRIDHRRWSKWSGRTTAGWSGLSAGGHTFSVRAKTKGRVGPVRRAGFVVDLTPPQTSIVGPSGPATVLRASSVLRLASNERGATFGCSVDGGGFRPCPATYLLIGLAPGPHRLAVRATDLAGNTDPSPAIRDLVIDTDAPTGSLFSDDFETGDLSRWTVSTKGTGTAVVQRGTVRSGNYAATLSTTSAAGSTSVIRTSLAGPVADLTLTAALRVDAQGAAGGNVPLIRLFDGSGNRLVNLYRQNLTGQLWVQLAGSYTRTSAVVPMATWTTLSVRVAGPKVTVGLDGTPAFSTATASLAPAKTVQIGNEMPAQPGTLDVDDVTLRNTGADTTAPDTRITSAPSGTLSGSTATISFSSSESGSTFQCSLDHTAYAACSSPRTLSALSEGEHTFSVRAVDPTGNADATPATVSWTQARDTSAALLIADNQNRRILITDYSGNVLWQMDNPTGESSAYSGPLGVRWMANGHILATFGTGKVGEIDPATKTFVWQTAGFKGDWFKSPYDAEVLPDGNLAVALAQNNGGRVTVYNRTTGATVWSYPMADAHLAELIPAGKGTKTGYPTILTTGWKHQVSEVVYAPGKPTDKKLMWKWNAGYNTHRAILDRDGHSLVITDWNSVYKIARPAQTATWVSNQHNGGGGEARGIAMTATGYVLGYRIWYGASQIRFFNNAGKLTGSFSRLSDGTSLNLPWGVRTITWNG